MNGYSKFLDTNSIYKKVIWLFCTIPLVIYCMILVEQNYHEYRIFSVVSHVKVINNETAIFPAVTFCVYNYTYNSDLSAKNSVPRNLSDVLYNCSWGSLSICTYNDFEYFPIYVPFFDLDYNCYKINGGRNITNHETDLFVSVRSGIFSALNIVLNLTSTDILLYYVGDTHVRPVYRELNHWAQAGSFFKIGITKIIDNKLPAPYNQCMKQVDSDVSELVQDIFAQNTTYRQSQCFELCFYEDIERIARSENITKQAAYLKNKQFDYDANCSDQCPLECDSTTYAVDKNVIAYDNRITNLLDMNFYYVDQKYTEITQSEKTTEAGMISNNGGILGLFLEISFISIYRLLSFILDFIFHCF